MRLVLGILALIGASAIAVADTPTQTPAQTSTQASAPTPTKAASTATPATPDPREKMLKAKGYRVEMRNGEKMYCRNEEVMGSRIGGRKICGTAEDLLEREHMSRDMAESAQRQQLNPVGK